MVKAPGQNACRSTPIDLCGSASPHMNTSTAAYARSGHV
jgi:hypothetical protein